MVTILMPFCPSNHVSYQRLCASDVANILQEIQTRYNPLGIECSYEKICNIMIKVYNTKAYRELEVTFKRLEEQKK